MFHSGSDFSLCTCNSARREGTKTGHKPQNSMEKLLLTKVVFTELKPSLQLF